MFTKIKKRLITELDADRYEHTIGVADTAACLAMRYGIDSKKAYLAGLLHDVAKCIPADETLRLCEKYSVPVSNIEKENPFLLHGPLGAALAKEDYEIEEDDILAAICHHTTGRPNMTLLEEIVFAADYIEPNRKKQPRLNEIRRECFEDLKLGICHILEDTLSFLNSRKSSIDEATKDTYQYYLSLVKEEVK